MKGIPSFYGDVDEMVDRTSDLLNVRYYTSKDWARVRFIAANADNSDGEGRQFFGLAKNRYYLLGRVDIEQNRK